MRVGDIDAAVRVATEMLTTSKREERDVSTPPGAACASADRALDFASRHRGAAQHMAKQIDALISVSATLC